MWLVLCLLLKRQLPYVTHYFFVFISVHHPGVCEDEVQWRLEVRKGCSGETGCARDQRTAALDQTFTRTAARDQTCARTAVARPEDCCCETGCARDQRIAARDQTFIRTAARDQTCARTAVARPDVRKEPPQMWARRCCGVTICTHIKIFYCSSV